MRTNAGEAPTATFLKLLGRPRVEHDGAIVTVPAERRCRLLLVLALRRGWVERSELAALLWPEHRSDLAAANLRKAVHMARALPWAQALEVQPSVLRFAVPTDLQAIEQHRRDGRSAEALALCHGALLDGMDDTANPAWNNWLDAERDEHARRLNALTRLHLAHLQAPPVGPARTAQEAQQQARQTAAFARELLEADATDEDAVCALLHAQATLGERVQQREVYAAFSAALMQELGVEPAMRVRALMQQGALLEQGAAAHAAPPADGTFVGRTRELDEFAALFARDECRLLTVLGPGGVGKSTLLKRALRRIAPGFADEACWIALDDLRDLAQTEARIAGELKLAPGPQQETATLLCEHLASRQTLLLFDNAEHIGGLSVLIERLLAAAPRLKVCVTSRVRLGAAGEWLLPLGGLELPALGATDHDVLDSDAARLFVAAATATRPDFAPQQHALPIAALVHATGGLPLAVLLAAHWVRHLPVAEIVQELQASLDVLDSGSDEGDERPEHRSMLATFERSWQLLSAREQHTLAALAVFAGSFSRDAALAVAGAALPLLASLADKSLLQLLPGGRCALHPLIRSFALKRLAPPKRTDAERRHAQWYLRLLLQIDRTARTTGARIFDDAEAEIENCRQAWCWAVSERRVDDVANTAMGLVRWFDLRGRPGEALALMLQAQGALCSDGEAPVTCAAQIGAMIAHLQTRLFRLDEAAGSARAALKYARMAGRGNASMVSLAVLGFCHWQWGRSRESQRYYGQALRLAQAIGDASAAASIEVSIAVNDIDLGNHAAAEASLRRALVQQRAWSDWNRMTAILANLAELHQRGRRWLDAAQSLDEALALCEPHPEAKARPYLLVSRAMVSWELGDRESAQRWANLAVAVARPAGDRYVEALALLTLGRIALPGGDHGETRVRLQEAAVPVLALRNPALLVDGLLLFALLRQADGDADGAAPLLRQVLAWPELDAYRRAEAEAALARLPAKSRRSPPPPSDPETLMQRLAAEAASA